MMFCYSGDYSKVRELQIHQKILKPVGLDLNITFNIYDFFVFRLCEELFKFNYKETTLFLQVDKMFELTLIEVK